ncbi:hypothetical protein ABZX85_17675 [Streptomyces sp. NPDC004539]|uniref:hypothetical protein n=1 Tax=Streptomyces sp. NPDC004539 TaxID=3154280 RepID=UPI0033A312A4
MTEAREQGNLLDRIAFDASTPLPPKDNEPRSCFILALGGDAYTAELEALTARVLNCVPPTVRSLRARPVRPGRRTVCCRRPPIWRRSRECPRFHGGGAVSGRSAAFAPPEPELDVLAGHHADHGAGRSTTFPLVHDTSVQWGVPGAPELKSLVIGRDRRAGLFRMTSEQHSLASLGQVWLIARGCPRKPILRLPDGVLQPADEATRTVEERLVNGGYAMAVWHSRSDPDES